MLSPRQHCCTSPVICLMLAISTFMAVPASANTITALLTSDASRFSFIIQAAEAIGLTDTLNGPGPFTIFAAPNQAFLLARDSVTKLVANPVELRRVLLNHVVSGTFPIESLSNGMRIPALGGGVVEITVRGNVVKANGATIVPGASMQASNGIIHVIESVILSS